jgi:adenine deaminase
MKSGMMEKMLAVARGEESCDVLFRRARILNVFTGEIEPEQSIAIFDGRVAGIGDYNEGKRVEDLAGAAIAPGFIDAHIHLESTLLKPAEFAKFAVLHGTAAVVADPHELVNVRGSDGLRYMIAATRGLPLSVYFMVPPCVPATELETSGARLAVGDIVRMLGMERVIGLAEMMNYSGVVHGEKKLLDELAAADRMGVPIDGHCPAVHGHWLNAYLDVGVRTDHESTTAEEGREKLRRGMFLMVREGSSEKNLEALLPLVTGYTDERCMLVTDDRSPTDLARLGHMDHIVRKAIGLGLPAPRAYALATINPARYYRLPGLGAVAPGYNADFVVLDSVEHVKVAAVYHAGERVAAGGRALFETVDVDDSAMRRSVRVNDFSQEQLRVPVPAGGSFPVIEIVPGQIVTRRKDVVLPRRSGFLQPDVKHDILKLAVVERHAGTGNIGLGFVKGFSLARGAIATSVAHDSHNIVGVGVTDADICRAVEEIVEMEGGMVVVADSRVLSRLPLPIAGLLSDEPAESVMRMYEEIEKSVASLGSPLADPMAALSFLALPVIPELRVTDRGLFDVTRFEYVNLPPAD